MQVLLAPLTIALLDVLVIVPLVIGIIEIVRELAAGHGYRESAEIVTGIGVILIGWGVALEERHELREIFGVHGRGEEWQSAIDHHCKSTGIGALIFGLFAEMCIEAIKLPNHIIYTEGFNEVLVGIAAVFMALTAVVLARHVMVLVPAAFR
jgi:hypothetical protein